MKTVPHSLLQHSKKYKVSGFAQKVSYHWKYVDKIMDFDSAKIEEYYHGISKNHSKKNIRDFIKIIILYWCGTLWINKLLAHYVTFSLTLGLFCVLFNLICYLSTMFLHSPNQIETLNVVVLLSTFLGFLAGTLKPSTLLETHFTPVLQISFLMFANLPIPINNAVILWAISFGILSLRIFVNIEFKSNEPNLLSLYEYGFHLFIYDVKTDSIRLRLAIFCLAFGLTISCFYLYFINHFHRRLSFIKLGHNIQSKLQLRAAIKVHMNWIEAIMPKIIKDVYWEHNAEIKLDKCLYIKNFDNVSILFADIVGFTIMSSKKSAARVVALLNDLFNRFDELCSVTHCEKLGTLGDCYYCVAGCPIGKPDHAISCIEMGLGMCRIIRRFNWDHKENVKMRVGVHTGRVNAAILGKKRFRFDVYSNDVIIANTMESSGKPDRVHISESVYEYVRHAYVVEKGDDLEIKREAGYGIAGMLLKSSFIKTYFIDPQSSHIRIREDKFSMKETLRLLSINSKSISSIYVEKAKELSLDEKDYEIKDFELKEDTYHANTTQLQNKIKKAATFIEGLQFDVEKKIKFLTRPPINMFTLMFLDKETEWHFNIAGTNYAKGMWINWVKLAPILDILSCFTYSSFIYLALYILFPDMVWRSMVIILLSHLFIISFFVIITCQCYDFKLYVSGSFQYFIDILFSHPLTRSFICLYCLSTPLIIIVFILNDCTKLYQEYYFTIRYFILIFYSLLILPLFLSAHYFVKLSVCILNIVTALSLLNKQPCVKSMFNYTYSHYSCSGQRNLTDTSFYSTVRYDFIFQITMTSIVVILVIREIEINMRLLFFVTRENKINCEEASIAMINAQEMLYNIIPKYVFNQLKTQPGNEEEIKNFNYASAIPKAAVVFACISNFFSSYYREDYKSGENALRLLHQIICHFDDMIKKDKYKTVEKIKTINDCYMVASGLNLKQLKKAVSENDHLHSLMSFSFELIKTLDTFNENFIIGTDKFEIKIGYNFGPLTAGIIGTMKPMYDIWGDTVNVSSRMYTTCPPGNIQCPEHVFDELKTEFYFRFRGNVNVKGKGPMKTFLCVGPLMENEVHRRSNSYYNAVKNPKLRADPISYRKSDIRGQKRGKKYNLTKMSTSKEPKSSITQRRLPHFQEIENVFVGFAFK